ncbi:MAG: hypothetical protein SFV55_15225 [Haliscomenobacter sp.]|uniref:hypothetical protein n=1 Tax=Haliscomenobacter sp. TaxID=2717303 RepID=UPI0029BE1BDA|nr:hypothetical protein [Haliscomenobacter sp.]MDX2069779.1 hypothetical protein [Haliscomenobacter sp.]
MCRTASNHLFLLMLFFCATNSSGGLFGQAFDHPLYELEERIMEGDKDALFEIALYFDSKKDFVEYVDFKEWTTKEATKAKRIVRENCQFLDSEIMINDSTSGKQFFDFLFENRQKIFFSKIATSFILTPLENRMVHYEIRELSPLKKKELQGQAGELLNLGWVKAARIDSMIVQKSPEALHLIAVQLFKHRRKSDNYSYPEMYIDLLQFLTDLEIGVKDNQGKFVWQVNEFFYDEPRFNLLVFFVKHHQQFAWNEQELRFINPQLSVRPLEKEEYLFQLLSNENDSLAMDAFIQLSSCPPQKVISAASEYFDFSMVKNDFIPIFPCAFITKTAELTAYCRDHGIDYEGSALLQKKITLLRTELPINERVKLESELIQSLKLEEITALEYWALVYESRWQLGKSTRRILNEFYLKNWQQILAQPKHLDLYLKKANLLYQLTYQGFYNDYRGRFSPLTAEESKALNNHSTQDMEVKAEIELLLGHKKH